MFVVLATALFITAGMLFLGWLNARRYRVNARVEIGEPVVESATTKRATGGAEPMLAEGEVARMAVRVREVSGLLLGLTMLATTDQMNNRRVASVETLVDLLARRALLPPGVQQQGAQGVLASEHAIIYVRYRPQPLGVEVVSVGRERIDGPTVIGRLATDGDEQMGAVLLMARRIERVQLPAPFAPLAEVVAMNWSLEPLRERVFTQQEIEQLNSWARQYAESAR